MSHANQNTLNVFEKRRHERANLACDKIPGKFHIRIDGEKLEFTQVNDVSISGMGILLESYVSPKSCVIVGYDAEDFCIEIQAEIVWQERLSDAAYQMGIHFSNDNVDDNVMLFMTLREYIDDFGARS